MNIKKVLLSLKKAVLPLVLCFSVLIVSLSLSENLGGFIYKVTLFSSVVAMPQGAPALFSKNEEPKKENETSSQTVSKEQEVEIKTQNTETPSLSQNNQSQIAVTPPENSGKISEYAIKSSETSTKIIKYSGAYFSNTSNKSNSDILKVLKQSPKIPYTEGKPQVLIYHTHTTESYELNDLGYYIKGSSSRTTNEKENMVRVGEEIAKKLKEAGIEVIHDKTVHDYPSYNGAYQRSAQTVNNILKKYPSISITLDIHRDAIEQSGGVRVKPTALINGKKAAQIMIIGGVDDGTMDYKNWKENLKFASSLQVQMEKDYKGLTRAVMVCHRRYNMHLTDNSLLIEMGGHANTLDEAVYSGSMLGTSLSKVILQNRGK